MVELYSCIASESR